MRVLVWEIPNPSGPAEQLHAWDWERCWQTLAWVAQRRTVLDWFPPKGTWNAAGQNSPLLGHWSQLFQNFCVWRLWGGNVFSSPETWLSRFPRICLRLCLSMSEIVRCCSAARAVPTTPTPQQRALLKTTHPLLFHFSSVCPRWLPCLLLLPLPHTKLFFLPPYKDTSWLKRRLFLSSHCLKQPCC